MCSKGAAGLGGATEKIDFVLHILSCSSCLYAGMAWPSATQSLKCRMPSCISLSRSVGGAFNGVVRRHKNMQVEQIVCKMRDFLAGVCIMWI